MGWWNVTVLSKRGLNRCKFLRGGAHGLDCLRPTMGKIAEGVPRAGGYEVTNHMGVPRHCRGGSGSLTYTAVVLRETCDGLRHDVMRGGNKAKFKQLRSRMQPGKHRQMGLFSITSVGHLGEAPMSSWRLLDVSVIGIGEVSLASPSRFERLTH